MGAALFKIKWNQFPFLIPTLALIIGIVCYFFKVPLVTNFIFLNILLGLSMLLWLGLHLYKSIAPWVQYARLLSLILVFVFLGIVLSFYNDPYNQKYWYGNHLKQASALHLELVESPAPKTKIVRLETKVKNVQINGQWIRATGIVDINLYKNDSLPSLKIGDDIIVRNQLVPIINSGNPFSFKQADYAQLKGKYHQGFFDYKKIQIIPALKENTNWISNSRNRILRIIKENVSDTITAGLVAAVIVNERANMDKDLWEDYSRTGIAHIVAISGMHITLFFIILGYLVFFIRHKKYDWVKYAIILPIAWIYIIITGFPPSAVRAGIMFTILSVGIFLKRDAPSINVLMATAFIILLFEPSLLFDVGFQLSFLSVLSIFIFYKPIADSWKIKNKILDTIWQTAAVSIAVQVLLFPLLIYYFHQFPLWSIIANIPAALYSFIFMVLSLLLIFMGYLGIPATYLGNAISTVTDWFHIIVRKLSDWSPDALYSLYIDTILFWILSLVVVLFSLFIMYRNRKVLWMTCVGSFVLIGIFIHQTIQKNKQHLLIVYNINNKTLIEEVKGRNANIYHCDLFEKSDKQYSITPAHIGLGVKNSQEESIINTVFQIGNKKVLVLNQAFEMKQQELFKVDYLIITKNTSFQPEIWAQIFLPDLIIIDGSVKRYKAKEFQASLSAMNMNHHWVLEQGAFVIKP